MSVRGPSFPWVPSARLILLTVSAVLATAFPSPASAADPPTLSVVDASVVEGHSGSANGVLNVKLSAASAEPVTVDYATSDGTASAADYTPASGTLTFAAGETTRKITVPVTGETVVESNESVIVSLSNPSASATIADGTGTLTILNDDRPAPGINVADISVLESFSVAQFSVRLTDPTGDEVVFRYQTVDGTAKAGSDYRSVSGLTSFAPGESLKVVTVPLLNDVFGEPPEIFGIALSEVSPGVIAVKPTAIATIYNDDPSCVIPSLVGKTPGQAKSSLVKAGCRLGRTIKRYSTARKNRVTKSSPPAGLDVYGGMRVAIVVSKGPRPKPKAKKKTTKKKKG